MQREEMGRPISGALFTALQIIILKKDIRLWSTSMQDHMMLTLQRILLPI